MTQSWSPRGRKLKFPLSHRGLKRGSWFADNAQWLELGAALENADGKWFNISLDVLPVGGFERSRWRGGWRVVV